MASCVGPQVQDDPTQTHEYRYQHRGYSKYADIVRLFGWEAYTGAYHQLNKDFEAGEPELQQSTHRPCARPCEGG